MIENQTKGGERMSKFNKRIIYAFCILNSISGLQILGIKVNAIIVGLFLLFIIAIGPNAMANPLKIKTNDSFFYYLTASAVSCIISCMHTFVLPHKSVVISYLINCVMYIIMYMFLVNYKADVRKEFTDAFVQGLIYAARIQAVWGIIQIVLLYSLQINVNQILFVDILHSTNTNDWAMGFYSGDSWVMRMTGLNYENSMFALVVCIGMVLENNSIWRLFLMATAVLSLSRTGWVMVAGYLGIVAYRKMKTISSTVSKKKFYSGVLMGFGILAACVIIYNSSSVIQLQINNVLLRLTNADAVSVSGARHFLYYPYGVLLWFTDVGFLQKLFGYGMRASGIAFHQNERIARIIGVYGYNGPAWAVECDVIGLLLGGGIITFILYYATMYRLTKVNANHMKDAIFILLFGGLTYHYHSISYVVFVIMIAATSVWSVNTELTQKSVIMLLKGILQKYLKLEKTDA